MVEQSKLSHPVFSTVKWSSATWELDLLRLSEYETIAYQVNNKHYGKAEDEVNRLSW